LPWGRAESEGVWHFDGEQFERLDRRRSSPRPAAEAVPAPFRAACRALARAPGVDAVDAWAFPVLPRDAAPPPAAGAPVPHASGP
jgi:hypothetical protein